MECVITSQKGVGRLLFGMSASQVRALLRARFRSFKRTSDAACPCDLYADVGLFAYYDASGHLDAVELVTPAVPSLCGTRLLDLSFDETANYLSSMDPQLDREADGAVSLALGVSLYAPQAVKNPKARTESVLVFAPGYYD